MTSGLSGSRKAAVFLMGLSEQVGAEVLRHLSPEEVRRISAEVSTIRAVGSEQMASVYREFESLTAEGRLFAQGGVDCARRLVENAFGPESAQKLLAAPHQVQEPKPEGTLANSDPKQLALFLRSEHPQTIAVVLSSIPAETAATLLKSLPEETQAQAALRMASLERVSADVFEKVRNAIGSKLKGTRQTAAADGVRALAALLNHADPDRAKKILTRVEEHSLALADSVRSLMFVFEDVLNIDKEAMKALVAKLDRKALTTALKGASSKLRLHFTQCMSQRAGEMLAEDMEALGPVRIRDVKAAQKEVLSTVRRLQQEGAIAVGGGREEYVV
jgi:flagellar motor switch protein FliG